MMKNAHLFLTLAIALSMSLSTSAQTTQVRPSQCQQTGPFTLDVNVLCDIVSGAAQYQFFFEWNGEVASRVENNYSINLSTVSALQYGRTYDVYVRWRPAGGEWSAFGDTCTLAMADEIPTTKLRDQFCSTGEPYTMTVNLLADFVAGADSFHFAFNDGVNEFIYPSNNYSFFLYEAVDIVYGQTYDVYVRSILGTDTSAFGDTCQIMMSAEIPTANIMPAYCQPDSIFAYDATVLCDIIHGYDGYQWEFIGNGDTVVYVSDNYSIDFNEVPGVGMGRTYDIRVAAIVGTTTAEYGESCSLTIGTIVPSSYLLADFCSTDSLFGLSDTLEAFVVSLLVEEYIFHVFSDGYDTTIVLDDNELPLALLDGLLFNATYGVVVEVYGANHFSTDGDTCYFSTQGLFSSVGLLPVFCSADTLLTLGDTVSAEVPGAGVEEYRFTFSSEDLYETVTTSGPDLPLLAIEGLLYGEQYWVSVQALSGAGSSIVNDSCLITMADAPLPIDLLADYCEEEYPVGGDEAVVAEVMPGGTDYEFRFAELGSTEFIGQSINETLTLSEVDGLMIGEYSVDVRGFAGGAWSNWGLACEIEVVDTVSSLGEIDAYPGLGLYPNPSADAVMTIDGLDSASPVVLSVFDAKGLLVYQVELMASGSQVVATGLGRGLYLVNVSGEKGRSSRLWMVN